MSHGQRGSALVEFIGVGVALAVPLTYAVIALAQLQESVQAVHGASQMAARAYVQAPSDVMGRFAAMRAAAIAGRNHGLVIELGDVAITCGSADCLVPGRVVSVRVRASTRVGAAGFERRITVSSTRSVTVDPYRQVPS